MGVPVLRYPRQKRHSPRRPLLYLGLRNEDPHQYILTCHFTPLVMSSSARAALRYARRLGWEPLSRVSGTRPSTLPAEVVRPCMHLFTAIANPIGGERMKRLCACLPQPLRIQIFGTRNGGVNFRRSSEGGMNLCHQKALSSALIATRCCGFDTRGGVFSHNHQCSSI